MNRFLRRTQWSLPVWFVAPRLSIIFLLAVVGAYLPGNATAQHKVRIGTGKDPNLGAQIAIAKEKAFFGEYKIDAEIIYFPSGGDLMTAIVGGSVDIGASGSTPVITLRSRPYPIEIVSQIADMSGAQQILVKPSITSVESLRGKSIGVMNGTSSEGLFNAFVKAYDFDVSTVTLVNMAPAEMLASFARGDVDAIAVWEPHATRARKLFKGSVLVTGTRSAIPGKEGQRKIYGDHSLLFAKSDYIREQPEKLKLILRALAKANAFIASNPDEAARILGKEFGVPATDMLEIMKSNVYTLRIDLEMVQDIDSLTAFLHHKGRIQSKPAARDWIYSKTLLEVRPDLVDLN